MAEKRRGFLGRGLGGADPQSNGKNPGNAEAKASEKVGTQGSIYPIEDDEWAFLEMAYEAKPRSSARAKLSL